MAVRQVFELPLAAQGALRAGLDLLNRVPEIERSITRAGQRAGDTFDEILERVRPIELNLEELKSEARDLRSELAAAREDLRGLDERIDYLAALASRIEGSAEHVLDKVPGLSADKANKRANEIASEERESDAPN